MTSALRILDAVSLLLFRLACLLVAAIVLIVLYDVFFGNGLCGVTINCNASPW